MTTLRGNWTDSECFYVDAVDGKRVALLAGPFKTLPEAEAHVERATALAIDYDPKAHFSMERPRVVQLLPAPRAA